MKLSIGDGYIKNENITGIFLPKGEHIVLVDGIEKDKEVTLLIPNWDRRPPDEEDPSKDEKGWGIEREVFPLRNGVNMIDRKSTRLNSSHVAISYAVFCLKKKRSS